MKLKGQYFACLFNSCTSRSQDCFKYLEEATIKALHPTISIRILGLRIKNS